MNTRIKKSLQSLLLVPVLALSVVAAAPLLQPSAVYAADCPDTGTIASSGDISSGLNCAKGDDQPQDLFTSSGIFTKVVNVLLFIIGAVAVIMLIYGGFKYVVSGGDANAVTSAKNTILYAVIGIIVALLAFAILNFVVGSFKNP